MERCEVRIKSEVRGSEGSVYVATAVMSRARPAEGWSSSDRASVKPTADNEIPAPEAHSVGTVLILYSKLRPMQTGRGVTSAPVDIVGAHQRQTTSTRAQ